MRHALALLAAAALGFVLGALWQGDSAPPRAGSGPAAGAEEPAAAGMQVPEPGAAAAEEPTPPVSDEEETAPAASTCGIVADVIGIDGAPPETARVSIGTQSRAWTPKDRFVPAAPGVHLAAARTPVDGARSDQVLVTVRPGAPPTTVALRLLPRPSLRVLVVLPPGIAEADVHLYMRPFRGANVPPLVHPRKLTGRSRYERRWLDRAPGRYLVAAQYRRSPDVDVRQDAVVDGDSETTVTLRLPPPDPACIPVHVLGPDGAPAADAQARIGWHDPTEGNAFTRPSVARRDDGALLVPPAPPSVPPQWTRLLEVRAPAFGYLLLEFPQGGTVRLREPGWIEARLTGGEGAYVVTDLSCTGPDGPFNLDSRAGRATDGRQGFGPLQPGSYGVSAVVTYPHLDPGKFSSVRADVQVESGRTTRVVLHLPEPR